MKYIVTFQKGPEICGEFCPAVGNVISLRYKLPVLLVTCKRFHRMGVPRDTRN